MKYKPCCGRRCGLANCKTQERGGCYCTCRLVDMISSLESVIEGRSVARGCIYYPNAKDREKWFNSRSKEEQEVELHFRSVEAPALLEQAKKRLKEEYEIS